MKFSSSREDLLKPLQMVGGVVEKRQTLPILSNVLIRGEGGKISITATDLEMEVIAKADIPLEIEGAITVPVRKLQDTCKALQDSVGISFEVNQEKAILKSGKTRFTLTTLPAENFPVIETKTALLEFKLKQSELKKLIEQTQFAMAAQDVRYYLNGLLLEIAPKKLTTVATDGHRLALCSIAHDVMPTQNINAIIPRKAVMEISRLLEDKEDVVVVTVGENFIRFKLPELIFTSKLIDGQYPSYENVIPKGSNTVAIADKEAIKHCLIRTSILSNEKYRGIRLVLDKNQLVATANNPEQEEAEDEIEIDYQGDRLEIGFNVTYLLDAISAVRNEKVQINFTDANGSVLIQSPVNKDALYVVMPMRI